MRDGLLAQLSGLDLDRRIALADSYRSWTHGETPRIRYGDLFSGSGVSSYVAEELVDVCKLALGVDVQFVHEFSCEIVEWKRSWILHHFNPKLLFADATDLIGTSAKDMKSGEFATIPLLDILLAGFECDSVSKLFNSANDFQGSCVRQGQGKTGKTARIVLDFMRVHRPLVALLENVTGLAGGKRKDLDFMLEKLRAMGYEVIERELNAKHFRSTQNRNRLYLLCVLRKPGGKPAEQSGAARLIESTLTLMQSVTHPPMSSRLAPDDHASIDSWKEHRQAIKKTDESNDKCSHKYETEHMVAFLALDVNTYPPMTDMIDDSYPQRQREMALYYSIVHRGREKETAHDLNLSIGFASRDCEEEECFCLASSSRPWLRVRQRSMNGDECLVQQGFDYRRQVAAFNMIDKSSRSTCEVPIEFTHHHKIDLAGNAFNGYVVGGILVCLLCSIDFEESRRIRARLAEKEEGNDDDEKALSELGTEVDCRSQEEGEESEAVSDDDIQSEDFSPSRGI